MYKYSPIKEMQIKNFRNIGDISIDFTESPIVTLIGENESGKTSVVKAFAVCALHAKPKEQKAYIRDNTTGFGVNIKLEDGTEVTRIKTATNNRYTVSKNKTVIWDADKLENDVPKAVNDAMGLFVEPETKEFIQIRTYEDQLLFVTTPSSTNYKVMYDALKISQLTRAIKLGSNEANQLKNDISVGENGIETLHKSLDSIKTFDIEPLKNIRTKLNDEIAVLTKLDSIISLKEKIEQDEHSLGNLSLLSNAHSINEGIYSQFIRANRFNSELNSLDSKFHTYSEINTVKSIDVEVLSKINSAEALHKEVKKLIENAGSLVDLRNASEVSETTVNYLNRAIGIVEKIKTDTAKYNLYAQCDSVDKLDKSVNTINKMQSCINSMKYIVENTESIKQINEYVDKVISYMKSLGVATTTCPKCGESIVIDLDVFSDKES